MVYFGNWNTNNGNTFNGRPYKSSNKRELRKELREICNGNLTGPTDIGRWSISDIDGNVIMSGVCRW
jgi:hypothetical protein